VDPVYRYGKAVWDGDFKVGYRTKIFGRTASVQLNIRNIFGRTVGVGWKPATDRSYAHEQFYYEIPASYALSASLDL
jgi:hypothetical protein